MVAVNKQHLSLLGIFKWKYQRYSWLNESAYEAVPCLSLKEKKSYIQKSMLKQNKNLSS